MLRGLAWLQPPLEVVKLGVFLIFAALGLFAWWRARRGRPEDGRRAADRLIVFVLAVSVAVGVSQQESWPFSNWALVHGLAPRQVTSWEIEAMDATGRSWPVDPRVLQPLSPEEFGSWMASRLPRLVPAAREGLARFILERAEAGRRRLRAGGTVGVNESRLGPLSAPYHFHAKVVWRRPADVPEGAFVGVRIWATSWDVDERMRDETRVGRRLLLELPARPPA